MIMRKYFTLMLPLVLFTLASAGPPFEGNLNVIGRCASCCIETYPINFTITIDNTNSAYYYYVNEYWVATESGTRLNSVKNQNITIPQHTIVNLYIDSNIPTVLNNTFGYKVCIRYNYFDDYDLFRETERCSILSTKQAFPISNYFGKEICCRSEECAGDEKCTTSYVCQQLNCGSCQYILNHNCYSYECCANSACNSTSTCVNNVCTLIECAGEIVNQTCIGFLGLPVIGLPEWISGIFGEDIASFIETNLIMLILGIVFLVVFVGLIIWLFRGGPGGEKKKPEKPVPKISLDGEDLSKEEKKSEKKTSKKKSGKKDKKKNGKKKGKDDEKKGGGDDDSGPEYVPLIDLPE
jgi:hypothetical protein